MKKIKFAGNILFWMTIISLPLSFSLCSMIGEADIFGVAGIVRYSWIMWLFIPIGILSIMIGISLKKYMEKYKKNYIVAFVCIPLLLIFGSYRFLFNSISYDVQEMISIEEKVNLNLPDRVKIATNDLEEYSLSYAKIIDEEEKVNFQSEIKNNNRWCNMLNPAIKGMLPIDIQSEIVNFDYFVFYSGAKNEYNICPTHDGDKCVFIAYDSEVGRFLILKDYTVSVI